MTSRLSKTWAPEAHFGDAHSSDTSCMRKLSQSATTHTSRHTNSKTWAPEASHFGDAHSSFSWHSENAASFGRELASSQASSASGRLHYEPDGAFFESSAGARNHCFAGHPFAKSAAVTVHANSSHFKASQTLFELSVRGREEVARARTDSPRRRTPLGLDISARSRARWASTSDIGSSRSMSDFDAVRGKLSFRSPSPSSPPSRRLDRTPAPPPVSRPSSSAAASAPVHSPVSVLTRGLDGRATGELCLYVGSPRWLPVDMGSCYVTATCLETGEVETSQAVRPASAMLSSDSNSGSGGGSGGARVQSLRLPCTASSTVALHVVSVKGGVTTSEGGTVLAVRHVAALSNAAAALSPSKPGGRRDGGAHDEHKLRLVAPLGVPVDLAWQPDKDVIS